MQIVWIGTSLLLGMTLLLLDDRFYETFAYVLFGLMLILLFATIFNPHSIKGSRSWLVLGPLRLQPAEFAKFATSLALAKFMSRYGFDIRNWKDFLPTLAIIFVPMLFIVLQRETGSALVYLAFFLMLYREGMTGSVLFTGVAMVIYFVVGIRYADVELLTTTTSVGKFTVMLLIHIFTGFMVWIFCKDQRNLINIIGLILSITLACLLFSIYVIPFNVVWVQYILSAFLIAYLIWQGLAKRLRNYYWVAVFTMGSVLFFSMADYALNNILEAQQRTRISVL